jgi:O-antigen/teichoic acid export membrane protein
VAKLSLNACFMELTFNKIIQKQPNETMSKNNKFTNDLIINLICFGLIGAIGIVLNLIIRKQSNDAVLGVFNQIYAIYVLLSQLAVGGVHLSVQKYVPENAKNTATLPALLVSALISCTITSILVIIAAILLRNIPGYVLQSEGVGAGFVWAVPGLLFFSLNKVMLSYLNGLRQMKTFAGFQLLRFIVLLGLVVALLNSSWDKNLLASALGLTELIIFLPILVYTFRHFSFPSREEINEWRVKHQAFSRKAFAGNFLMDVNTKVDTFLLGIFCSDATVGIYSFVATIVEGITLLPALFRNNLNPIITKAYSKKNPVLFKRIIQRNIILCYKIIGGLIFISILCFPIFLYVSGIRDSFWVMSILYTTLCVGLIVASGYLPFQMIFNQVGMPGVQTRFIFYIFMCNFLLNLIFIPFIGIYGAALATGATFVAQVVIQRKMVIHYIKLWS